MLSLCAKPLTAMTGIPLYAFPFSVKPLTAMTGIPLYALPLCRTTYGHDRNPIICFSFMQNHLRPWQESHYMLSLCAEPLTAMTGIPLYAFPLCKTTYGHDRNAIICFPFVQNHFQSWQESYYMLSSVQYPFPVITEATEAHFLLKNATWCWKYNSLAGFKNATWCELQLLKTN